ncbi:MAG: cold shock domain-containing protein [Pseudomonadales bacterium]|nr:cold shock domain-containing protein [Pseudomonadales bacterium]
MFLHLIIAAVTGFIFAGFFAAYSLADNSVFHFDILTSAAFVLANLSSVLIYQAINTNSKTASSSAAPANKRASAKSAAQREQGSVKWFNVSKGFGFITRDNADDIFVHYRSIRGQGRRRLFEGQAVSFTVIDSDKGLQADDVEVID